MARTLTVGSDTFEYPEDGSDPGWGGEATDWAEAITDRLQSISNASDISATQIDILNNVSGQLIPGLVLNPVTVRGATIPYAVYRTVASSGPDYSEVGEILTAYQTLAATGSKWLVSQQVVGDAGISFSIDDSGQVRYTTSDLSATGTLTFRAATILQTI